MLKFLFISVAMGFGLGVWGNESGNPVTFSEVPYRVLLWVDPSQPWEKRLSSEWKVVARERELVLLQGTHLVTNDILNQLRKVPGVLAAKKDYVVFSPERNQEGSERPTSAETHPETTQRTNKFRSSPKSSPKRSDDECPLTEVCSDGLAKYWAQDAVDAEAMKLRLAQMGVQTSANVAVVDSGFDGAQKSHVTAKDGIRVESGLEAKAVHPITGNSPYGGSKGPLIGDLTKDESGHGTMVTSTIAGEGRLGVAPGVALAVYRVTKPGDTGSTTSAILDMAVYRACREGKDPDGITIINMSWGGRLDETGIQPDEKDDVSAKLLDRLAEMGCLVVKASGNDNFRRQRQDDPDDAYLRVAAIDASRELADFSTVGEIQAPGERVILLESTTAKQKARADRRCGGDRSTTTPQRFANGTSFAAPIAAGLAAQVVKVLKSGAHFKDLASKDRIRLINRVLQASTQEGSINGLRAVVIAQHWNEASEEKRLEALAGNGVTLLASMAVEPPDQVCDTPIKQCDQLRSCEELRSCFATGREQVALCPGLDFELPRMLAKTAFRNRSVELGYYYARVTNSRAPNEKTAKATRREMVQHYLGAKGFKMNFAGDVDATKQKKVVEDLDANFVKSALAPYLADLSKSKDSSSKHVETLLQGMLASPEIQSTLDMGVDPKTNEDRGSAKLLDSMVQSIQSGRKIMGDTRFSKMVKDYVTKFNDNLKVKATRDAAHAALIPPPTSTSAARVLDRLISAEPQGSRMHQVLTEAERTLFEEMRNYNQRYGNHTMPLVFLEETFPSRPVFNAMMDRQWEQTRKAVQEGKWETLSPVEVHYLLGAKRSDGPALHEAALGVLAQISSGRGWGRRDDPELTVRALEVLHDQWTNLHAAAKEKSKEQFLKLSRESVNPEFLGMILNRYWSNEAYGIDPIEKFLDIVDDKALRAAGKVYSANPFLDRQAIGTISKRLATLVISWRREEGEKLSSRSELFKGVGLAWRGLSWASTTGEGEVEVPPFSETYSDRLTPVAEAKKVKVTPPTTERYLAHIFGLGGKSGGTAVSAGFRIYTSEMEGHSELPKFIESAVDQPTWRAAAKKFVARGTVNGDGGIEVKDFLARLGDVERWRRLKEENAKTRSPVPSAGSASQ